MEKFLHAINCAVGSNRRTLAQLWKKFENWQYVWEKAGPDELAASGVKEQYARRLIDFRRRFDADAEFAKLWEKDIVAVSRRHSGYPRALFQLPDAPFLLYSKGASLNSGLRMIALVGTRNPSVYGEKIAYDLAEALAERQVVVVSGLAFGIDAIAHFAAASSGKPTAAVLASGLFDITPSTHHRLSEKILEHGGTLVSEYPPSDPAYPGRFLERNRIIAGLCEATVVIEAGEKSGALVTARLANEYGRDVYTLPGDITREQAQGCLQLLFDGAQPVVSISKFLEARGLPAKKIPPGLSVQEQQVVDAFEGRACSTDELIEKTSVPVRQMNILLAGLEFKGVVHQNTDSLWAIPRSQ